MLCVHCKQPIRKINYALGPEWMHVNPSAGFPTERKGTAWRHCKRTVATPADRDEDGSTSLLSVLAPFLLIGFVLGWPWLAAWVGGAL